MSLPLHGLTNVFFLPSHSLSYGRPAMNLKFTPDFNLFNMSRISMRTRKTYISQSAKKRFERQPNEYDGAPPVFMFLPSKMGHNKGCKSKTQLFRLSRPKFTQKCHRTYLKALGLA